MATKGSSAGGAPAGFSALRPLGQRRRLVIRAIAIFAATSMNAEAHLEWLEADGLP
jgi:hypothetical protein